MRLLVGVVNDEENGGSCGSHGWMERGRWCRMGSQDHLRGGWMLLCICV